MRIIENHIDMFQFMVVTPSGLTGHLVHIHVVLEANLDHDPVLILSQCMEEMTAQIWVQVLILRVAWINTAQVNYIVRFRFLRSHDFILKIE